MTECNGQPAELALGRYLQGTLPELEARRFEEHYFECDVCLAQLEALDAARRALAAQPVEIPQRTLRKLILWPAIGSIAAALIIGFVVVHATHRQTAPTIASDATPPAASQSPALTQLASLADTSLPPYRPAQLRSSTNTGTFTRSMEPYLDRRCDRTVPALAEAIQQDPRDAIAAHFYRGACELNMQHLPDATADLDIVAAAGDSPQQEAALYYLAQTALANNDGHAARSWLTQTIALHGDFERRAQAQLQQLP